MPFEFSCPSCNANLSVEESSAGRLIRCGGCLTLLRVPDTAANGAAMPAADSASVLDPEPQRPRRRRRHAPPPSSGRGVLFWVVVIFGVLIVGGCSCCGGIYLLLPDAKWRKHESAQGGFRVDFPAQPKRNMPIPGMKADPNTHVEGAMLLKRGELYAVMYWDIPPAEQRAETDEKMLDEAARGIKEEPVVRTIVRQEPRVVSGFPAREIEYVATDGGTYVRRVVVAEGRLFTVIGGGRFVRPGNANIRRYLDSFEVTSSNQQQRKQLPRR